MAPKNSNMGLMKDMRFKIPPPTKSNLNYNVSPCFLVGRGRAL